LGHVGRNLQAQTTEAAGLIELSARWVNSENTFARWTVRKTADGYASGMRALPLVASTRLGSGTISSNLFAATDEARIPAAVRCSWQRFFPATLTFIAYIRETAFRWSTKHFWVTTRFWDSEKY
jgi:hypothetical protein